MSEEIKDDKKYNFRYYSDKLKTANDHGYESVISGMIGIYRNTGKTSIVSEVFGITQDCVVKTLKKAGLTFQHGGYRYNKLCPKPPQTKYGVYVDIKGMEEIFNSSSHRIRHYVYIGMPHKRGGRRNKFYFDPLECWDWMKEQGIADEKESDKIVGCKVQMVQ